MDLKPQQLMKLGGGALLFIGSFLNWYGANGFVLSGIDTEINGLQGIFALLVGLAVGGAAAIAAFAPQVKLPDSIAGIELDEILFMLSVGIFLMCFGGLFIGLGPFGPQIGLFFCLIGSGVATAGYFIDRNGATASI